VRQPTKVAKVGDKLKVRLLEVNMQRKRIALQRPQGADAVDLCSRRGELFGKVERRLPHQSRITRET
jgi:transcriptional accessory protein Tex/SPT6